MYPRRSRRLLVRLPLLLLLLALAAAGCGGGGGGGGTADPAAAGVDTGNNPLQGVTDEVQGDDAATRESLDSILIGIDNVYAQYGSKIPSPVDLSAELVGQIPQLVFTPAQKGTADELVKTPNTVAVFTTKNSATTCLASTTKTIFCGVWKPGSSKVGSGDTVAAAEAAAK